jgi:hypothetical protein
VWIWDCVGTDGGSETESGEKNGRGGFEKHVFCYGIVD